MKRAPPLLTILICGAAALLLTTALPADDGVVTSDQADDPLLDLTSRMTDVARALGNLQTGPPVQARQAEIVRHLDQLIGQLQQTCSSCQSCAGGQAGAGGGRPLSQSAIVSGPGGVGDLTNPGKGRHQLDNLSKETRERILQSREHGFPPGYERILEEYFRRLAEQHAVSDEEMDKQKDPQRRP